MTSTTNAAPNPESTAAAPSQNFTPEGQPPPAKERHPLPEGKVRYHNSADWQWLSDSTTVVPGVKVYNKAAGTECSAGFFGRAKGRDFMITAGHCGDQGDDIYGRNEYGEQAFLGRVVESEFTLNKKDWALVDVSRSEAVWRSTPPFTASLVGYLTVDQMDEVRPQICRLGWRTGLSCGDYRKGFSELMFEAHAPADHGDSGGPAFAIIEDKLYAAGFVSSGSDYEPDRETFASIAPVLEHFDITLYS
ncbi:S1 family peptidase [Corynebacterium sp. TAE3-ERU30]|uniref:S1 family peptidase n=1 Tax=Corynebacterium sp. TAE3-ERU30 TaxID=2849496 RepID=UPI001C443C69|nr:S1 family peptidase [Corynebacterium sp. TAE3-ERU30]MBV7280962.1 S1 family peptidase [Corynebacterium sp. TAE3-ERU30]